MSDYSTNSTNQGYQVVLSRTGGQGSKGDSITDIYVDENKDIIVVISNAAGEIVEEIVLGSVADISGAELYADEFVGDGVTTEYALTKDPVKVSNAQIYIDGAYQNKSGYTLADKVITF
jgi:hypothetical protein